MPNFKYIYLESTESFEKFNHLLFENHGYDYEEHICIGAVDEDALECAGIIVISSETGIINIDYLYVDEDYRGYGLAGGLLNRIYDLAMDFPVPPDIQCAFDKDNDSLLKYFSLRGDMDIDLKGTTYSITREDMAASTSFRRFLNSKHNHDTAFIQSKDFKNRYLKIINSNIPIFEMTDFDDIDFELSQIFMEGRHLHAFILVHLDKSKNAEIRYLYSKNNNDIALLEVISNACRIFNKKYPDSEIYATCVNNNVNIKMLFPTAKVTGGTYVARWIYTLDKMNLT